MFTTSRYASGETRKLAMSLARGMNERFVARGKKTINELAAMARNSGDSKIYILEERAKKAFMMGVISVNELGTWSWEEERILNVTENKAHESEIRHGSGVPR